MKIHIDVLLRLSVTYEIGAVLSQNKKTGNSETAFLLFKGDKILELQPLEHTDYQIVSSLFNLETK